MAVKPDPKGKGYAVGNTDDSKRGRHLGGRPGNGWRNTNPVTVEQVKERRGLKGRKDGE